MTAMLLLATIQSSEVTMTNEHPQEAPKFDYRDTSAIQAIRDYLSRVCDAVIEDLGRYNEKPYQ